MSDHHDVPTALGDNAACDANAFSTIFIDGISTNHYIFAANHNFYSAAPSARA